MYVYEATDNSGNHADLLLLKFALARSNGSRFLYIIQYKMPFINKSEATKMVERPKNKWQIYKWQEP